MQFSAAPDVAASLIVGARTADQILADVSAFRTPIPGAFWVDLRANGLIEQEAPTPG
jgi:D-threo-aldose 1-dehydrogenase